jgi:hypothetical protein
MELIIGGKYTPFQKTVFGFNDLKDSVEWKVAKRKNQNYLYYNGLNNSGQYHCFSYKPRVGGGDFFDLKDVIPYIEENKFILGAKYVPTGAERISGTLDSSKDTTHWDMAKAINQPFLYCNGERVYKAKFFSVRCVILGVRSDPGWGDYYGIESVKLYQLGPDPVFLQGIWDISTDEQRKSMCIKFPTINFITK